MRGNDDSFKKMEFLLAIDQFVNTWFNGYADSSISGRCYFLSTNNESVYQGYWETLRKIVDWGFLLVDGEAHCQNAYINDPDEIYSDLKSPIARGLLFIIVILFCGLLGTISRCVQKLKRLFS